MSFFKDGISIDEARVSALVICLIGGFVTLGYVYINGGTINELFVDLLKTLIFAVAGVNAINIASKALSKKSNRNDDDGVAFRTDRDYFDEDKMI